MSIAPIHPSPPLGAAEGVRQVHAVLDRCASVDDLSGYAASSLIVDLDRAVTRLQALKFSLVARVDQSDVASDAGMTGTAAWLAARSRSDGATAAREVRLATALDGGLTATREALGDGDLTTEHALVIATVADQLPAGLDATERAAIEVSLVAVAKHLDPAALRRKGRRALESAQRSQAQVDAHEDAVLRSEEDRALAATKLTLHDNHDGTTTGHFTVPTLAGQVLTKVIQQIASPRRFAQQAARDAKARAASLGAAHLDTGHDISASEVRRLACGAGIVPAVLDGESQLLDLGRTQRFFTEAQRVALSMKYDSCAAEDCDRPYAWTEQHHEDPWASGGQTDLDKAVPLCGFHHRRMHHPGFHHRIDRDPHGRKHVTIRRRT